MNRVVSKVSLLLFALGLLSAADRAVSRKDFGEGWPLTVESGTLRCSGNAVTFVANGSVYAVNGTATGRKLGKDIAPIWAAPAPEWFTDPKTKEKFNMSPPKKSIGPLINAGLALCK